MSFIPKTWVNKPSTSTPITAEELNRIEAGIAAASGGLSGQSMYLMGDSITNQCGVPAGSTINGTTYAYDVASWWCWAQTALKWRFAWLGNAAVGGTTTTQQASSQLPTVLASTASHVLWLGGVNDLAVSGSPNPVTTISSLLSGYNQILAAGKRLIVCTIYRSSNLTSSGQISAHHKINQFIKQFARTTPGVILFDVASFMTDPSTGRVYSSLTLTEVDSSHINPNNAGAMLMGSRLAELLKSRVPPLSPLISGNDDPYNAVLNGLIVGTSGWTVSNGSGGALPGTSSVVSRIDGEPGSLYEVNLAATGSDNGVAQVAYQNTTTFTSANFGGHVVVPRLYFEADAWAWANIYSFKAVMTGLGASFASYPFNNNIDSVSVPAFSSKYMPTSGILQGPPITVPASGVTQLQFLMTIQTKDAAAGSGTFRVGQLEVHDQTACGY